MHVHSFSIFCHTDSCIAWSIYTRTYVDPSSTPCPNCKHPIQCCPQMIRVKLALVQSCGTPASVWATGLCIPYHAFLLDNWQVTVCKFIPLIRTKARLTPVHWECTVEPYCRQNSTGDCTLQCSSYLRQGWQFVDCLKCCEFWHSSRNICIVQQQNHLHQGCESPGGLMVGPGYDHHYCHSRGLRQQCRYHLLARPHVVLGWQGEGYMGWLH